MKSKEIFDNIQVYQLNDIQLQKDIFIEPTKQKQNSFNTYAKKSNIPIIIDYGSGFTKAGYATQNDPQLCFRSLVSKTKDTKSNQSMSLIATKYKDIDIFKGNFRSPYEKNIIQYFGLFESINDYIFSELQIQGDFVNHCLIISEPLANPEYCRINLLEQLFECYGVQSVMIGVDALFTNYQNFDGYQMSEYHESSSLIISIGNSCTHIIPIIKGEVMYSEIKRVNIGVGNCFELLYKSLNLKHQHFKSYLDYLKCLAIMENLCECAIDFDNQLEYFKKGKEAFVNKGYSNKILFKNKQFILDNELQNFIEPVIIDFPNQDVIVDENEILRKKEMRKKAADRLREAVQKKQEEKLNKNRQELQELVNLLESEKSEMIHIQIEQIFGKNSTVEDVHQRIKKLKLNLGIITKEQLEAEKFHLINTPDSDLTSDQKKIKRQQQIIKSATEARAEKKKLDQTQKDEYNKWKEDNPEKYLEMLYEKRNKIVKKLEFAKKQKLELSQRNSKVNQKRMQKIAQLGVEDLKMKDDNFGQNDEDWDVYRGISKYRDQDSEDENENGEIKLTELDIELREIDPDFEEKIEKGDVNPYQLSQNAKIIELSTDRIRGPEVLFQPGLCGIEQCGLTDAIVFVLQKLPLESQKLLLKNILITGGGALLKKIKNRIHSDLYPYFNEQEIIINIVNDPINDAWKGMKKFYDKQPQLVKQFSITKEEYFEKGNGNVLFKNNPFSNTIIERI